MPRKLVAGALALSLGLAMGLTSASAYSLGSEDADNPALNGERILGVDISDVALTPSGVQGFLATLSPQAQQSVVAVCQTLDTVQGEATQSDARYAVVPFCDLAVSVIPAGFGG